MILVDAGVLIDFLRIKDPKLGRLFRSEPVAICGVTRAEILAGDCLSLRGSPTVISRLRQLHETDTRPNAVLHLTWPTDRPQESVMRVQQWNFTYQAEGFLQESRHEYNR